jgi:hypothetical protein
MRLKIGSVCFCEHGNGLWNSTEYEDFPDQLIYYQL